MVVFSDNVGAFFSFIHLFTTHWCGYFFHMDTERPTLKRPHVGDDLTETRHLIGLHALFELQGFINLQKQLELVAALLFH